MKHDEKGVIFSQWTSHLDVIEQELRKEGYTYCRIDGTMSADARQESMERFDTESCDSMRTPRFILCSLMAWYVDLFDWQETLICVHQRYWYKSHPRECGISYGPMVRSSS